MENKLQQLYTDFINEQKYSACLRPETTRGYRAVFDLFIKVMPEVTSLDFVTQPMLNEYFKRIQTRSRVVGKNKLKTGVRKSTIKTHWSKLNVFFKWLKDNNHIEENPLKGIKKPRVRYTSFKRLEKDQIDKIYSAIVNHSTSHLMASRDTFMISLLLYTGVRKGEFISLQIKDLDLYKNLINIRGEISKSDREKKLPIHPTLRMHLKNYLDERRRLGYKTEYLIVSTKKDRGLSKDGLKHWTERLEKLTGIDFHLHMLRHTFACVLTEKGTPTASLQKLMGHLDIRMTSRYTRSLKAENMSAEIGKLSFD